MTEKIGILALGHGSRHPHNKEVVNGVAELIFVSMNLLQIIYGHED